jgi:hypothetical protein
MHHHLKTLALVSAILFSSCGTPSREKAPEPEAHAAPALDEMMLSSTSEASPAVTMDQVAAPCSANETGFKTVTMGPMTFELPVSWSIVNRGDIAPISLPPEDVTYIDSSFVQYSFAKEKVAYGDINWEQVDVFFTDNDSVIPTFIERLKSNADAATFTDHWEAQTIGGIHAEVQILKKNPDGSVDKGATGGAYTYFPEKNIILYKQAFGDEAFENGFRHFLESIRFER